MPPRTRGTSLWQTTVSTVLGAVALLLEVACAITILVGGDAYARFSVPFWAGGFISAISASIMRQNKAGIVLAVSAVLMAFPVVPFMALSFYQG